MKSKREFVLGVVAIALVIGFVPLTRLYADCRTENFEYTCMGVGTTTFSPPGPPYQGYQCFKNDEGIGETCDESENEPDGAFCEDVTITCHWNYWLSCPVDPETPDGPPTQDSREVDSSKAVGIPSTCGS